MWLEKMREVRKVEKADPTDTKTASRGYFQRSRSHFYDTCFLDITHYYFFYKYSFTLLSFCQWLKMSLFFPPITLDNNYLNVAILYICTMMQTTFFSKITVLPSKGTSKGSKGFIL